MLKPLGTYERVRTSAQSELGKLLYLRHPNITYVYDAFEYRDTFYIITERCFCPTTNLFGIKNFNGQGWLLPIARCILQAIHFVHINRFVHQDIHPGNIFTAFVKDEMPTEVRAIQFKLGDLGVAKLATEVNAQNTRAEWLLPPEVLRPSEFGQVDYRIDIYHMGLLLLQLGYSKELRFTKDEILRGKPREMALALPPPLSFGLEKSLRPACGRSHFLSNGALA